MEEEAVPIKKEAGARIKINRFLQEAGWRFFDDENGRANVCLEVNVKMTQKHIDDMGIDFEKTKNGFIDFLLVGDNGRPLIVLEAKSENKNLLSGKEQARGYARSLNCRFVILSNGNQHYFWDTKHGNPHIITRFPSPDSIAGFVKYEPDSRKLVSAIVENDYIALIKMPDYKQEAGWKNESDRKTFISENELKFLRNYQTGAVKSIQAAVKEGNNRFLFEMATGTGKTLTSAAVIKLFLSTNNARRVLFLVDRLELEAQADKELRKLLRPDFTCMIYKQNKQDWRRSEVVVTTVQSLLFNNKYRDLFSPTDFELVISDEAHRSINGNARALFEYFVGYKLGLTATPKDYLKNYKGNQNQNRERERRDLLDTYLTFGCGAGEPTFRYSLLDGVEDGHLINPKVLDARTDITTQLLSDQGYAARLNFYDEDEESEEVAEKRYKKTDFEKKFFSEATNRIFCKAFLDNALCDPISGEIGKTIIFTVSQNHAAKIVQILNQLADKKFPKKYQSDFAMQVTSHVQDARQFTIDFASNRLSGSGNFNDIYHTSKTRICVTVGMMTTGYDCPDILNLVLMRPIFSPTDFVQIKGRGTRRHGFYSELTDLEKRAVFADTGKEEFKLFDFFANCEYFEEEFNYDEVLSLPSVQKSTGSSDWSPSYDGAYIYGGDDEIVSSEETQIGPEGMRVDRMFFDRFVETVQADENIKQKAEMGQWEAAERYVRKHVFDKPEDYFNLEKLQKSIDIDRRISLKEILQKAFNFITKFKSRDDILNEEFQKFLSVCKIDYGERIGAVRYFFDAYALEASLRKIIDEKDYVELYLNAGFTMPNFQAVPEKFRECIPEYIKNYIPLNQFM